VTVGTFATFLTLAKNVDVAELFMRHKSYLNRYKMNNGKQ